MPTDIVAPQALLTADPALPTFEDAGGSRLITRKCKHHIDSSTRSEFRCNNVVASSTPVCSVRNTAQTAQFALIGVAYGSAQRS